MKCILCNQEMEKVTHTIRYFSKSSVRLKRPPVSKKKRIIKKVKKRWGTIHVPAVPSTRSVLMGYQCSPCKRILSEGINIIISDENTERLEYEISILKKYEQLCENKSELPVGYSFP